MDEHNRGKTKSTKYKRPAKLVFQQVFGNIAKARRTEYKLKQLKSKRILTRMIESGKIDLKLLGD